MRPVLLAAAFAVHMLALPAARGDAIGTAYLYGLAGGTFAGHRLLEDSSRFRGLTTRTRSPSSMDRRLTPGWNGMRQPSSRFPLKGLARQQSLEKQP
jgi:hypothetical protein